MPSNHPILCRPLLLLPSIFPSIRVFSNKSAIHIRWPKYWSFSISPSREYAGLICNPVTQHLFQVFSPGCPYQVWLPGSRTRNERYPRKSLKARTAASLRPQPHHSSAECSLSWLPCHLRALEALEWLLSRFHQKQTPAAGEAAPGNCGTLGLNWESD